MLQICTPMPATTSINPITSRVLLLASDDMRVVASVSVPSMISITPAYSFILFQ